LRKDSCLPSQTLQSRERRWSRYAVTPTEDCTRGRSRTAVKVSNRQLSYVLDIHDGHRHGTVVAVSLPELAIRVFSPAHDSPIGSQRTSVPKTSSYCPLHRVDQTRRQVQRS